MVNMENMENQMESTENRKWAIRNRIGLIATIICCIAILASGTAAYFTAQETSHNIITTGMLSMRLVEEGEDGKPFPKEGVTGILPNMQVTKKPYVENTGDVDMYVRIAIQMEITSLADESRALDTRHISLDINTADWTEKDGYYYYNRVLKPGEATEPLFTKVSFSAKMGNEYMNARAIIDVDAQAVQSKNNTDSPLTAAGWPKA